MFTETENNNSYDKYQIKHPDIDKVNIKTTVETKKSSKIFVGANTNQKLIKLIAHFIIYNWLTN